MKKDERAVCLTASEFLASGRAAVEILHAGDLPGRAGEPGRWNTQGPPVGRQSGRCRIFRPQRSFETMF